MKLIVGVADMKLSRRPGEVIVTHGLGSCLGIAVHDASAGVGGLLHVMMPAASANPEKAEANPYMFVDTGVPAFLDALERAGANRRRAQVAVAGGAQVNGSDYFAIGRRNAVALKKVFWKSSVLVDAQDVGGTQARTMYLEIGSGRVWLSTAGQRKELFAGRPRAALVEV
jgi:chemotaxis protein CheD